MSLLQIIKPGYIIETFSIEKNDKEPRTNYVHVDSKDKVNALIEVAKFTNEQCLNYFDTKKKQNKKIINLLKKYPVLLKTQSISKEQKIDSFISLCKHFLGPHESPFYFRQATFYRVYKVNKKKQVTKILKEKFI